MIIMIGLVLLLVISQYPLLSPTNDSIHDEESNPGGIQIDDGLDYTSCSDPTVRVDSNGTIYAVWKDSRLINETQYISGYELQFGNIFFSKSINGGRSFEPNKNINLYQENIAFTQPIMAIDELDYIYIGWIEFNYSYQDEVDANIYIAQSTNNGENFSDPVLVDNGNIDVSIHQNFAMIVDKTGTIHVAFAGIPSAMMNSTINQNWDIYYTKCQRYNEPFILPLRVNDDFTQNCTQGYPSMDVDDKGNAFIVWRDNRNSGNATLYFSTIKSNNLVISQNTRIGGDIIHINAGPAIAVFGNNIYVVWQENSLYEPLMISKSFDSGRTFSEQCQLNGVNIISCKNPQIKLNREGVLFIVWSAAKVSDREYPYGIYYLISYDGGKSYTKIAELSNYRIIQRSNGKSIISPQLEPSMDITNNSIVFSYVEKRMEKYDDSNQPILGNMLTSLWSISFQKQTFDDGTKN